MNRHGLKCTIFAKTQDMEKIKILRPDWQSYPDKIASIGDDIILLERPAMELVIDYPFRIDVTTAVICLRGGAEGAVNLKPFRSEAPCLITLLPGQILEHYHTSDDFRVLLIVMSNRFTESLIPGAQERLPLFLSMRNNPYLPLDAESMEGIVDYFNMLRRIIRREENPYRMEVVRYLTLAMFYGMGSVLHSLGSEEKKSHNEALTERFLVLVQTHYRRHRSMEFYADKLCLTPKHLSKVIHRTSGRRANDWIDEYVLLEAKALLKSTDMTVQQISDELYFPSQSFFGKYFKRHTGVSPREYKRK